MIFVFCSILQTLLLLRKTLKDGYGWLPNMQRSTPEEINPWSCRENLKPYLLYQRHTKVLTSLIQRSQLHGDNIHHNHQLFQPTEDKILMINSYIDIVEEFTRPSYFWQTVGEKANGSIKRSSQSILTQYEKKYKVHIVDCQI